MLHAPAAGYPNPAVFYDDDGPDPQDTGPITSENLCKDAVMIQLHVLPLTQGSEKWGGI